MQLIQIKRVHKMMEQLFHYEHTHAHTKSDSMNVPNAEIASSKPSEMRSKKFKTISTV